VHVPPFVTARHLSGALLYPSCEVTSSHARERNSRNAIPSVTRAFLQDSLCRQASWLGMHYRRQKRTPGYRLLMGGGSEKWILPPSNRDRLRVARRIGDPRSGTIERNDRVRRAADDKSENTKIERSTRTCDLEQAEFEQMESAHFFLLATRWNNRPLSFADARID